jgi:dipeptidyl aminopeptidase/acylaminoacyl peptidase
MDPRYSPDGSKVAFISRRTQYPEVWVAAPDGSGARQLTFQAEQAGSPSWSPNGRQIAFESTAGGVAAVWLVGADGAPPRRLVEETHNGFYPSWSRDGAWIYYCSTRTGRHEIWKARFTGGGGPVQVTTEGGFEGYEAKDGYLYYTKGLNIPGIWRIRTEGTSPEEPVRGLEGLQRFRYWELGENGIYFEEARSTALQFFDFRKARPTTVARLANGPVDLSNPAQFIRGVAASPDGRAFLYVQLDEERSEVVLANTSRAPGAGSGR